MVHIKSTVVTELLWHFVPLANRIHIFHLAWSHNSEEARLTIKMLCTWLTAISL